MTAPVDTTRREAARLLKRVRQIRYFRSDPVPEDLLTEILDVARWTGSAQNRQPWNLVVLRDATLRRRVAERILDAASVLGLASAIGWVKREHRAEVHDLLGVRDPAFVRTIVSIGYSTDASARPKSAPGTARKPLAELVHQDRLT